MADPAAPANVATVSAYAEISVALSSGRPSEEVLAEHELDEQAWEHAEEFWQARLSEAMEAEHEGVPSLVAEYADAFSRAMPGPQGEGEAMSLERFALVTAAIRQGGDALAVMNELGIPVTDFLRANQVWTPKIASDPAIARRFLDAQRPEVKPSKT